MHISLLRDVEIKLNTKLIMLVFCFYPSNLLVLSYMCCNDANVNNKAVLKDAIVNYGVD